MCPRHGAKCHTSVATSVLLPLHMSPHTTLCVQVRASVCTQFLLESFCFGVRGGGGAGSVFLFS